jgi:single-strand DNA-binding protein
MASVNRVIVMGNLTRDPELRYTPSGAPVTSFGVAINRGARNGARGDKEEVTFVEVVAWGKQAEVCSEYLGKGRLVFIEGSLRQERWEGRGGEARSALKVVADRVQFLGNGRSPAPEAASKEGRGTAPEEEVPF